MSNKTNDTSNKIDNFKNKTDVNNSTIVPNNSF
jgi:hypothetical protein